MHNSGLHSTHWFALTAALVSVGFGGFQCQHQPFISVGNLDCLSNPPTKRIGYGWIFVR